MTHRTRTTGVETPCSYEVHTRTADRFWSKVDKSAGPDGCWLWTAGKYAAGYGTFVLDGRARLAHRVALSFEEDLRPGLFVLHSCDNPPCVNPAHLRQGTCADNGADMAERLRSTHGERSNFHKLKASEVRDIRRMLGRGVTQSVLADVYDVHPNTIHYINVKKTWKHV